jgi:transcription elongation factor GreA-like protein
MNKFKINTLVYHPAWGSGKVIDIIDKVLVEFKNGFKAWFFESKDTYRQMQITELTIL